MVGNAAATQRAVGITARLRARGFDDAEELGRGRFGAVYRCTQVALDRQVTVKVLTTRLDEGRARFIREQRPWPGSPAIRISFPC